MNKNQERIQKANDLLVSPKMAIFDWVVSFAFIGYGVYLYSVNDSSYVWYLIGGGLGCLFAYIRPAKKFNDHLKNRMMRKD
jgi:hypothetical protein